MADAEDYQWAVDPRQTFLAVAGCVTAVLGLERDDVLAGFGADLGHPPMALDPRDPPDGHTVAVASIGPAIVAVEYNGFQGARPEILRVISRVQLAVSVYWNVNDHMEFSYAAGGEVVTRFDPISPSNTCTGTDPERLRPLMTDLPFPTLPVPASLALAERVSGVRIGLADIDGARGAWRVTPVPDDPRPPDPYKVEADIVELVGRATSERLRALVRLMATRAASAYPPAQAPLVPDVFEAQLAAAPDQFFVAQAIVRMARTVAPDPQALMDEARSLLREP